MFGQSIFQGPGTGTFTSHTFEIIIMLLGAFGLGIGLGYALWSRYQAEAERLRMENVGLESTTSGLRTENGDLKNRLTDAESARTAQETQVQSLNLEMDQLRSHLARLENENESLAEQNRQLESELGLSTKPTSDEVPAVNTDGITAPLPSEPLDDELPDLEHVVNKVDTDTADVGKSNQDAAAKKAGTPEPTLLPLDEIDDTLNAPPTPESIVPTVDLPDEKKPDEQAPIVTAVSTGPRDDLKIVEGIGPKIEELLFKAGITTYGQLAATGVQQLQNILDDAGSRFAMHDPGTWSAQALLAANGEWDNLKAYQDFLNAGKRPDK